MCFAIQPPRAAIVRGYTARVLAGAAVLVIASVFCGGAALADGPQADRVAASHHKAHVTRTAHQPAAHDIANTASVAPPVVVMLSTAELSRGPAQANGPVSLPMSFGQPVAPEDELAATPAPARASRGHRPANHVSLHVSLRATHLATLSVAITTEDGVEVPDLSEFIDLAT